MATTVKGDPAAERSSTARTATSSQTAHDIWSEIAKHSFAVLSYVTPAGEPRSSGVIYKAHEGRLYVVVAPDSWKARHIQASGRVSVVVPVRRGGALSLVAQIPPATISFHAEASVHAIGELELGAIWKELTATLPTGRAEDGRIIRLTPVGEFLVYGLGMPLMQMKDAPPVHVPATSPTNVASGGR